MNNIDQLRQLMTLDADINTPEIELRFEQIASIPVGTGNRPLGVA